MLTVDYATANNTALTGSDYTSTSGTLTFSAGETMKTVTVQATGDTAFESSETFYVNLSGATGGAAIGDAQGVGTIVDNDGLTCPATVNPGASFNVTVSAGNSSTDWLAVYPDGAANNAYLSWVYVPLPRPRVVSLAASTTAGSYDVRLWANNSTATLLGACDVQVAVVPRLVINDVGVTEGNAGSANASFTVALSPAASGTVTVEYATANNTALAGSDYTATSGTLTFSVGETMKTATVPVTGERPSSRARPST